MINLRDVVKVKMPFPNINSQLALKVHMYICCENKKTDRVVKAQTYKPILLTKVEKYMDTDEYSGEHPFNNRSLIDLDKCFNVEKGKIKLQSKVRNNNGQVSVRMHEDIMNNTDNLNSCNNIMINTDKLKQVDRFID